MFMPTAFQISTRYLPTTWILARSPPILLFICANQSATLQTVGASGMKNWMGRRAQENKPRPALVS